MMDVTQWYPSARACGDRLVDPKDVAIETSGPTATATTWRSRTWWMLDRGTMGEHRAPGGMRPGEGGDGMSDTEKNPLVLRGNRPWRLARHPQD